MSTDLVGLATGLAEACAGADEVPAHVVSAACRAARETTGGAIRTLSTRRRQRVYPGGASESVEQLHRWLNQLPPSDVRKWAGLVLLAHALLGPADAADDEGREAGDGEIAMRIIASRKADAFNAARHLVERVISLSGGSCPRAAVPLARALVDAILREPLCDREPGLQVALLRARAAYGRISPPGTLDLRLSDLFETVTACFDRHGWTYHADRAERKVMVEFVCPLGRTRLVGSVPVADRFLVLAIDVIPARPESLRLARERIGRHFPEVKVHHVESDRSIALELELVLGDEPLTEDRVFETVVRINSAAESLLMLGLE